MSALKRCLLAASQQIALKAPDTAINKATLMTRYAVMATLAMTAAGAHAWGDDSPMPERQAVRWGESIGGAVGRMLGAGAVVNANNPASRAVQSAAIGISEDVGRWMGGRSVGAAYEKSPADARAAAERVPMAERDHLDSLGLKAIFAADDMVKTPRDSREYRAASDTFYYAQRNFEMAVRSASERRVDISPWVELRDVLQQAQRSLPEQRLAELGQPLVQRLNRPGGPGFNRQTAQINPLAQLRQQAGGGGAIYSPRY